MDSSVTLIFRTNVLTAAGYVPGEQPADLSVVKLNTNENPYPPSPRVIEAIRGVTAEQLRRYPSPSGQAFRPAAAERRGPGRVAFEARFFGAFDLRHLALVDDDLHDAEAHAGDRRADKRQPLGLTRMGFGDHGSDRVIAK